MDQHETAPDDARRKEWARMFERELELLQTRTVNSCQRPDRDHPANGAGNGADTSGGASLNGRNYLTGIAMSGGGIRSATVCLGVLQSFAKAGLLKHIDYLSSVSGGGYTAAATALRYAQPHDPDPDPDGSFAFGKAGQRPEPNALKHLRNHANYLTPGGLSGLATGVLVVARALLINLFIWITLGGAALALLMFAFGQGSGRCLLIRRDLVDCGNVAFFDALLVAAVVLAVLLAALMTGFSLSSWRMKTNPYTERKSGQPMQWLYLALAIAFAGLTAWLAPRAVDLSALHLPPSASVLAGAPTDLLWFIALVASFLLFLAFASICIGPRLVQSKDAEGNVARKYARRRYQEGFSGALLIAIAGLLVIGTVPVLPDIVAKLTFFDDNPSAPDGSGVLPLITYLVALATALFGFYRTNLRGTLGVGSAFVIVVGSAFVCWSALLVSYQVAQQLLAMYETIPGGAADPTLKQVALLVAPLVALALGFFANINDVSLGRFYRDRLMEAFMPDRRCIEDGTLRAAGDADRFKLRELLSPVRSSSAKGRAGAKLIKFLGNDFLVSEKEEKLRGPYPLINTNVMTPWHADPVLKARGGDNFILAPAYCGSGATGWKPTSEMMRGRMPLATAMAISGAAANPRGGFAGTGPTTSYVVAVAMALLSVRLGYWLRWNSVPPIRTWLNPFGNHFVPSAVSLVPRHSSTFVELTDGGHFENLGVYELVRRRCGLIIVCDGGDDRMATYASLTAAARRIEEDFGVTFAFDFKVRNDTTYEESGPQHVVARAVGDDYPKDAEYSSRGYFLASIRYPTPGEEQRQPMATRGPKDGLLIYLKSAMIRSLSLTSRGYKGANSEFPYESTADQFFSPEQFEAYRDVGVRIARQMLEDTNLAHLFEGDERPSLWSLRNTYGFTTASNWQPWPRPNGKDGANGKHPESPMA